MMHILDNGFYDVILGFGQGAAVATSWLLHEGLDKFAVSWFKVGIFICHMLPFSRCLETGYDARVLFLPDSKAPATIQNRQTDEKRLYFRMLHPEVDDYRIKIPTAHIHGREDPWRMQGRKLWHLCEEDTWQYTLHEGGHDMGPAEEAGDIVEVIKEDAEGGQTAIM